MPETRAHLHYGICRRCYGTGMAERSSGERGVCLVCSGEGAVA